MVCCSAFGCSNRTDSKSRKKINKHKISFHQFPKNVQVRNSWIQAVRRKDWMPSKRSVLCSIHFTEDCFDKTYVNVTKLYKHAVPTVFPGFSSFLRQNRWTITQVEALIAQYKTYPVLYSNSHKDRENVDLRNQCLSHVVQALQFVRPGVTAVDVVSQWNNLVIKYMQAARRQLEEPTGAEEPHLWYFKKMDFVGEHACLADVKVEDNAYDQDIFEPESTTEGHELWENGAGEDPLESSSRVSVKQEGDSPPTKKFREDEDTRESFSGSDRASKDENDVFGEFVAAELKKIADERIRQDTILEIHKVLHKALTKK